MDCDYPEDGLDRCQIYCYCYFFSCFSSLIFIIILYNIYCFDCSKSDFDMIAEELNVSEKVLNDNPNDFSISSYTIFKCHIDYSRFMLYWRTGGIYFYYKFIHFILFEFARQCKCNGACSRIISQV